MGNGIREPDDYDLRIDAQVEEFLKLKQQLTYFLITASVAIVVFAVSFAQEEKLSGCLIWLLVLAAIAGMASAGTALLNLHYEISSYRLHLKYRTERIAEFEDVPEADQKLWEGYISGAKRLLQFSFIGLGLEIVLASVFMLLLLT